jgi:hypothetical protein
MQGQHYMQPGAGQLPAWPLDQQGTGPPVWQYQQSQQLLAHQQQQQVGTPFPAQLQVAELQAQLAGPPMAGHHHAGPSMASIGPPYVGGPLATAQHLQGAAFAHLSQMNNMNAHGAMGLLGGMYGAAAAAQQAAQQQALLGWMAGQQQQQQQQQGAHNALLASMAAAAATAARQQPQQQQQQQQHSIGAAVHHQAPSTSLPGASPAAPPGLCLTAMPLGGCVPAACMHHQPPGMHAACTLHAAMQQSAARKSRVGSWLAGLLLWRQGRAGAGRAAHSPTASTRTQGAWQG